MTDTPPEVNRFALEMKKLQEGSPVLPEILSYPDNDDGRAQAFLDRHKENLLWHAKLKKWLVWQGNHWAYDENEVMVAELAKELGREAIEEARERGRQLTLGLADKATELKKAKKQAGAIYNRAVQFGNSAKIKTMLELTRYTSENVVGADDLDSDPWLSGVKNGVLDLKTGKLLQSSRELKVTKTLGCAFDPDARCPIWEKYLFTIMRDRQDLVDYLQEAMGYTLTGLMSEQRFWFLYGTGQNGKSKFIETMIALMGDYAKKAPDNLVSIPRNHKDPLREIATIPGYRMLTGNEFSQKVKLNESVIKSISGGDAMSGIPLYGHDFTFQPVAKVWLFGNYKPVINGTDDGIWRRVLLIPFLYRIPDEDLDGELGEKLKGELPGLLNWALAGLHRWKERGSRLRHPDEVTEMVNEYREDEDLLGSFIKERVVFKVGARVLKDHVFQAYMIWCKEANVQFSGHKKSFNKELKQRPDPRFVEDNEKFWAGCELAPVDPETVGG